MARFYTQKALLIVWLMCAVPTLLRAGWSPVVFSFSPADYIGGTQNWQFDQSDSTGWIYVANNYGLLEYDGQRWHITGIRDGSPLRSLRIGDGDNVYVGGCDEFGVVVRTEYDERSYRSLSDEVPEAYRPFSDVWAIHCHSNGHIFFQSHKFVFEVDIDGHLLRTLETGMTVYKSLLVGDNLYLSTNNGLYLYTGGRLHLLGTWPADVSVSCMARYGESILIGTEFHGLYIYSQEGLRPLRTDADSFCRTNQLYSMDTQDGQIVLGTVLQGFVLIDSAGHIVEQMNRESMLNNNTILSVFFDRDKNLWVGEDLGLDYVALFWPSRYLSLREEIGVGYAAKDCGDHSYLGTNQGLYYHTTGGDVHLISGTQGQVWRLAEWGDQVFCCHNRGLMRLDGDRASFVDVPEGVWNLWPIDDKYAYVCTYSGLYLVSHNREQISVERRLEGYSETMYCTAPDRWGRMWAISSRGVVCLRPNPDRTEVQVDLVVPCSDRKMYALVRADDEVLMTSNEGIWQVDESGALQPGDQWCTQFGGARKYTRVISTPYGYITVSPGRVNIGERVLFDEEGFFVGGFDNAVLSHDSMYVVVGGTKGFFCIDLPMALSELPNHPWKQHEERVIIPWYQTWWARLLSWLFVVLVVTGAALLVRYFIRVRDERLARVREQEIHRQQLRILQLENDKAHYELQEKSRRLNTALLGRVNRNEIIAWVQHDLRRVTDTLRVGDTELAIRQLRQIEGKLTAGSKRQEKDWQNFEESFDSLNPDFVMRLRERHNNLSEQEVKLCVYIQQGLQTKEIGPLLHLSTRGVEMMRYRLHSKLNLESQASLKKYILSI